MGSKRDGLEQSFSEELFAVALMEMIDYYWDDAW